MLIFFCFHLEVFPKSLGEHCQWVILYFRTWSYKGSPWSLWTGVVHFSIYCDFRRSRQEASLCAEWPRKSAILLSDLPLTPCLHSPHQALTCRGSTGQAVCSSGGSREGTSSSFSFLSLNLYGQHHLYLTAFQRLIEISFQLIVPLPFYLLLCMSTFLNSFLTDLMGTWEGEEINTNGDFGGGRGDKYRYPVNHL